MKKEPTIAQIISRAYFKYCARTNARNGIPMDRIEWEQERITEIDQLNANYPQYN